MKFDSKWHGLIKIEQGFELQNEVLHKNKQEVISLIGCEHHEVLSLGKSLWLNQDLTTFKDKFESIHKTERGGKLTLHNPGQLIIYPVLNLKAHQLTLKNYVCLLVKTSSDCLAQFGLVSQCDTKDQIGVYYDNKKVVSIGLRYQRGWVSHGLSINVNNELDKFEGFEICGHKQIKMTSLKTLGVSATPESVFEVWNETFIKNLNSQFTDQSQQCGPKSQVETTIFY